MATESTESSSEAGGATSLQEQFLGALQLTQNATLQFVSAWFDGATELVAKMADMTKLPAVGSLPEPPNSSTSPAVDEFHSVSSRTR